MARKDHKQDGRRNNGGRREGAGRPPGPTIYKRLRELADTHTEEAIETIATMMRRSEDEWLRLACANALLDRAHGKPREQIALEQQDTVRLARYPTLDEMKADLIAHGLPIDHLAAPKLPKLIEHESKR